MSATANLNTPCAMVIIADDLRSPRERINGQIRGSGYPIQEGGKIGRAVVAGWGNRNARYASPNETPELRFRTAKKLGNCALCSTALAARDNLTPSPGSKLLYVSAVPFLPRAGNLPGVIIAKTDCWNKQIPRKFTLSARYYL
jgi:hypothetical protein